MALDKGTTLAAVSGIDAFAGPARATDNPRAAGAVDTIANSPADNAIEAYARPAGGALTTVCTYPTAGNGQVLGSGHSIVVSRDGSLVVKRQRWQQYDLSVRRYPRGLNLLSTASSGRTDPNSVTIARNHLVHILNADSSSDGPESSRTRSWPREAASSVVTPKGTVVATCTAYRL